LNTPEWVIENVYKASKAAGPMAEWVKSIIDYADIFLKIEPLRKEVEELEN
jgi:dynein heavy chain 1